MSIRLVLASASPARLATLRSAGIAPIVSVSQVDEPALLERAATDGAPPAAEQVLLLARAKARDVAARLAPDADLVLGCDSMLELDGEIHGKPADAAEATARWRTMRTRSGVLHTGHWLVDLRAPRVSTLTRTNDDATAREAGASSETIVHFADVSDAEIDAYVATGEPLVVAGAFTIDGLGGPFVERIEGDHHGVVGLSLPLLRALLSDVGVSITDLWAPR
ncbi:Maf family protein [Georgenia sp. MJ173]|uniref:Maf family protein n=1 Tax=Georgenia sunbinii TaxID=3117728 RepID=UPI002F261688